MADISILARLIDGTSRNVDLSTNALVVGSLKLGASELTSTIAARLINLQNGSDVDATHHTHDGRYFTETELSSTGATSGADRIGTNNTPSNYTPAAATVQDHLEAIDAALASAGGNDFSDDLFRISDNTTPSKKIAFEASGISASTTRTVTMPDANVDLGNLTNSNISASAAIAESKLALDFSTASLNTAISNHLSDASDAHDASAISSVPAGNLAATDVQAALNELDSEKVAKSGDTMSGNLTMGGNKVTGLAAATANGEAVRYEQLQAALSLIENFEWQASALDYITDNTVAPPTEVLGDRYVLSDDGGTPHADWDGAEAGDIVEFDGALWVETNPSIGMMISIDDEASSLRQWTGSAWSQKYFESTTASTGLTKVGFDVRLDASAAGAGLSFTAGVLAANVDDSTIEINSDALRLKALGITNAHISASAAIAYSKLSLAGSIVNADINASAAIAYSKLNLSASIVDADVAAGAAIAYSKLALAASIVNADIAAGAAIDYSKLNLANSIVAADLTTDSVVTAKIQNAAVTKDKLNSDVADQSSLTGGAGSALAVQSSPLLRKSMVAGESFAANTSFLVRMAKDGETAGRVYKADKDASSADNFYVIGMALSTSAVSAGQSITVIMLGTHVLGSSDTPFAGADVGKPVFLSASGAFSLTLANSANEAQVRVGMVENTDRIMIQTQVMGIA